MAGEDTREIRTRRTRAAEDDAVEIEVLNAENEDADVSASYVDTVSRDDQSAEVVYETPDAVAVPSELPDPARRAAHRLERFAMNGPKRELVAEERIPIDENPVSAYLASLAQSSRRPMRTNLETVAWFVSGGRASAMDLAWWKLRYQHTTLIRSTLAATYAPATANLMLSAVRGVLKACFRLGYMNADDLQRAADVPPVRGSRLPPAEP